MTHFSDDELSAYALRPDDVAARERVEQHVADCTNCRSALDGIEQFDAALRDPLPWEMAGSMTNRREVPKNLLAQARAVAADDARARELVLPVTVSYEAFRRARVADDPRFYTLGTIRLLCRVANTTHEREPRFGLAIADAALAIAARLPEQLSTAAAWHAGTAWKERANALRYLGRFKEAEEALDRAVDSFRSDDRTEPFDLAIVAYVRSLICSETERFDEAIALAREAAREFEIYADVPRYLAARMAEAAAYYAVDRNQEAAEIFELVANAACAQGDMAIAAAALGNAASCYVRLGEYDKAEDLYVDTLTAVTDLHLDVERIRVLWALAALKVERGDYGEGIRDLDSARSHLARLGLVNDAALATLDLVAGLLAVGETDRVEALCRSISVTFASEGLTRSARKALAYLQEAVAARSVTADDIRHVRVYLERLPFRRNEEFSRLQ